MDRIAETIDGNQRSSYGGDEIRLHDERCARVLIQKGLKRLRLTDADLKELPKGHDAKCLLAWLAHSRTMVSHQWLSDHLNMGSATTVSAYIKRARDADGGSLARGRGALTTLSI